LDAAQHKLVHTPITSPLTEAGRTGVAQQQEGSAAKLAAQAGAGTEIGPARGELTTSLPALLPTGLAVMRMSSSRQAWRLAFKRKD